MASSSGPPKVHEQREPNPHKHSSSSSAAATSTDDSSTVAAAQGGAVASRPSSRFGEIVLEHFLVSLKAHPPIEKLLGNSMRAYHAPRSPALSDDIEDAIKDILRVMAQSKEDKNYDSSKKKLLRSNTLPFQGHVKKKLSDRKETRTSKSPSHVDHKKIPIGQAVYHYFGNIDNAIQQQEAALYLMDLDDHYSEFRPVHRDGESFYRSFMFSYLEQIVDRVDTREEDRLLDAVGKLASRAEHLQWASEFSQRREAFETLIEKIKGWKHAWENPASTISYNKGELLHELFTSDDTTDEIFAFLRLVAAIRICTHKTMYERHVTGLGEGHSLEDWCSTQVIPPRVHPDNVAMTALSHALGVALRVENTLDGTSKDLLSAALQSAIQASNTDARSIEDSYHIADDTPGVTLVRIDSHFDILYPFPPGSITTGFELPRPPRQRGSQQHPDPTAEASSRSGTSSRRAARASWFHCCIRGSCKK